MSQDARSVLTAEEWARELTDGLRQRLEWAASEAGASDAVSIHALAALALQRAGSDGGPLFTWETVDTLRWAAHIVELNILGPSYAENERYLRAIHDTAARLTSLLPPRKES